MNRADELAAMERFLAWHGATQLPAVYAIASSQSERKPGTVEIPPLKLNRDTGKLRRGDPP